MTDEPTSTVPDLLAALQRSVDAARADRHERDPQVLSDRAADAIVDLIETDRRLRTDQQTWEKRLGGTDIAETRLHLDVDAEGRVRVHEAVLAHLLTDAGWERTA